MGKNFLILGNIMLHMHHASNKFVQIYIIIGHRPSIRDINK